MERAHARLAPARSAGGSRRIDLVHRAMANVLGRLDPKTGEIKEYHPTVPQSGPHGLVEDKDGNIWFTANSRATSASWIRRPASSPNTSCPTGRARSAHAASSIRRACSGSRVQSANMVGRLDPKTGEIKLVTFAHAAIESLRHGGRFQGRSVLLSSSARPRSASIDPDTMAIKEYDAAESRLASAPHRHHQRRHHLVRRLFARLSGPPRSEDRRREGMAVAQRPAIAALRHHVILNGAIWYSESAREAEHAGALRSQDREVPDLVDSRAAAAWCAT